MIKRGRKWIKLPHAESAKTIKEKILSARGIVDVVSFLEASLDKLHDISLLDDAVKAINFIKEAIKSKKKIILYTDYDVDGMSAGSVGYLMLKRLGANVDYYTNDRFTQGYGLCISGINEIRELYPDVSLIITMDNGIVAYEGANYLAELGIDLIVTDHHDPKDEMPKAVAVVNAKRSPQYPFSEMCGAGLVWKLFANLFDNTYEDAKEYLDIVALATVGDVVPILDENRIFVKLGTKMIEDGKRPFFKVLNELTKSTEITAHYTLAFSYVPILNAVGRLGGDTTKVIDTMTSEDETFIREAVEKYIIINNDRKDLTITQVELAEAMLKETGVKDVILIENDKFHEGIVGLIAGRLKEEYNRPTIVLTKAENGLYKGSARSIDCFHIKEAFDECSDLIEAYGGHSMAAGLSIKPENMEKLEKRLLEILKRDTTDDDLLKKFYYIEAITPDEVTIDLAIELKELEPYGNAFEKPLFKLIDFNISDKKYMGQDKAHLKLINDDKLSVIGWRQSKNYVKRGFPTKISALGSPDINNFNGVLSPQFIIDDDNFKEAK